MIAWNIEKTMLRKVNFLVANRNSSAVYQNLWSVTQCRQRDTKSFNFLH
ncbi:Uncharacterized protein APZ42_031103 [Daphnia magna]|uniref:Uncharacterized protein n=1 Tax=Daphnia magna TaxID=35525 RepID=A0A164N512_9CRUS|nr:Uncharacterized protein APZ42_031103 [Daphnia magna]